MRVILILIAIGLGIGFLMPLVNANSEQTVQDSTEYHDNPYSIIHDEIVDLTDGFMTMLVQNTDNFGKVKTYNNKASLIQDFKTITTEEVVQPYIDYYYEEEIDGLYIVPTETPPWFDEQNVYDVVQLEKDKILVTQNNQSELYGEYGIDIEMTFAHQVWKITKITHR